MNSVTGTAVDSVSSVCRSGNVSETVVTAVAEAKGVDVLDLDPLYDTVDPDALDRLFDSSGASTPASMELSFSMAGCQVLVRGDGEVVVSPASADDDGSPAAIGRFED